MYQVKKYLKDVFRTTSILFFSVFLTIGLVAFALTYPATPAWEVSWWKFQEYFDKIFNGTCPEWLSLAGYDENKDPICLNWGSNIWVWPEGSVLTSTADGTYEWKFVWSLPKFQCSDEPAVNTKTATWWTAVEVPSYCMDKRCMLKYEMYLDSTDALYTRRFTEYEQFTTESNKWWSEYNTAGTYVNWDASSANIIKPFSSDYMVVRDDRSWVETSSSKFSVYDAHSKRYTKLYFCWDPSSELDTRDLTCNDFINTSTLTGWKSYDVPAECKTASGCELTVVQYSKSASVYVPWISKQYHFEQRGDNRWESSAQWTKLFQLLNGDVKSHAIIPTASSGDTPILILTDDRKSGTYIEYNANKVSVYDRNATNNRYRDIKVCTYE